ncbi:class I SAM-dependent methyltransferase [Bradyrhizobium japonicum]|uniref:class I SAM-dependent methyltransferase n=1 Tax=Bradyrhizobium japonicum TaxID=375 RepID=UPI0005770E44|nr:class I SAM-dependent methyltransferase [Bradyrhizobium japonicum]
MVDLAALYKARFGNIGLEKRQRIWSILCHDFFQNIIKKNASVLDLACGYGEFINHIDAAARYAVDLNPDSPAYLHANVSFRACSATNLSHLSNEALDVVFTSNFLEHLPDKKTCDTVLDEVRRVLKPDGRFIILGPNIRHAFREYWDYYDHCLPLSHLSLSEGLLARGFSLERVIDRFLPYTMNNNTPTAGWLIKAYLKLPIAWKFMGKQFLIIAKK